MQSCNTSPVGPSTRVEYKDTLVIGVSQSGQVADVRGHPRRSECGCINAAVTNNEDSPLAKDVDYHLFCAAGPEVSIAATKTFTSQMYILAMLCRGKGAAARSSHVCCRAFPQR